MQFLCFSPTIYVFMSKEDLKMGKCPKTKQKYENLNPKNHLLKYKNPISTKLQITDKNIKILQLRLSWNIT